MRVLYIGGSGRSGSTLLARLLHEQGVGVSVGELRYVWDRGLAQDQLCECGRPFRQCPFWTAVFERAFGGFEQAEARHPAGLARKVDRLRFIPALVASRLRTPGFQRSLDAYGAMLGRLYTAIGDVAGADVVVDSSKDPSYAFLLSSLPTLTVSFAHIVRDSRAVANSWTRVKRRPEIHWETAYMQRRPVVGTAARWAHDNVLFELLTRRHPASVRVRYEDLVAAVAPTLDAVVASTTGVASTASREVDRPAHSMSGNPVRFEKGRVSVVPDHGWQHEMVPSDRRVVTYLTSPLLLAYRYIGPRASATVPDEGALGVARRSLRGQLPPRYEGKLDREYKGLVAKALRPHQSVLDVGSGRRPCVLPSGRPLGSTYVGLDISAAELDEAAGAYDRVVVSDVTRPVPGLVGQFDLVLSFQVLEHVSSMPDALENIRSYLKPGGRFVGQFSGAWTAFGLLNRVVPHQLARMALTHLLNRRSETIFPARYDRCWSGALDQLLVPWSEAKVVPLYRGASYFHFAKPVRAGYLVYEEWTRRRSPDLASHYIVDAVK